jgi:predicted dehydrogenase
MIEKTKLGLIGVGPHMEKQLIPAIRLNKGARISAIYSSNEDKLTRLGYELDCEKEHLYTDWKKLIKAARVDAIIASGDPAFHTQVIKFAVKNNMPFFVEKPPLSSLKDFDYFEGRELPVNMVGYNFKYSDSYQELLDFVTTPKKPYIYIQKAIFDLEHDQPKEPIWGKESIVESFIYRLGIHVIDQTVSLFPNEVFSDLDCYYAKTGKSTFELKVNIYYLKETIWKRGERKVIVHLRFGNDNKLGLKYGVFLQNSYEKSGSSLNFENAIDRNNNIIKHHSPIDGGYSRTGYQGEIDHFVECVRENRPTSSPLLASRQTYEIIEKILESIKKQAYKYT